MCSESNMISRRNQAVSGVNFAALTALSNGRWDSCSLLLFVCRSGCLQLGVRFAAFLCPG